MTPGRCFVDATSRVVLMALGASVVMFLGWTGWAVFCLVYVLVYLGATSVRSKA